MFQLSERHMRALAESQYATFEDRMVVYLDEVLPNLRLFSDETAIRATVRHGAQHAGRLGFSEEANIAKLTYLHALLGRDFDLTSVYRELGSLVENAAIPPTERLDQALDWVAERIADGRLATLDL